MTVWRVGDFGRFKSESQKFPRFEVISSDKVKNEVEVWYSGQPHKTIVPREVFYKDCVNWWEIQVLPVTVQIPPWFVRDCLFTLDSYTLRAINVTLTIIREKWSSTTKAVDVKGRTFQFRRRKGDYVSCHSTDAPQTLMLIPLMTVLDHGRPPPLTRWDLLRTKDIIDLEDELF